MMKLQRALLIAIVAMAAGWCAPALAQQAQPKASPAAPAPPASALALAHQLLEIKNGKALYEGSSAGIIDGIKSEFLRNNLNMQRDLDEVAAKLKEQLRGREGEIGKALDIIYATSFTEDELKGLIAFYKTPLGQKLLDQEPKTLNAFVGFTDAWNVNLASEASTKFREEMKKRGKSLM